MTSAQPTPTDQRIESMDVLRGVAVLGILLLNINSFALPIDATTSPYAPGYHGPMDAAVFAVVGVLAGGKFMSLFALLFGAGFALMIDRRWQRGEPAAGLHYRRVGTLAALGFIHGVFIWYGDILLAYAACGALLYPLIKWAGPNLGRLCIVAWAIALVVTAGCGGLLGVLASTGPQDGSSARVFDNEIALMRGGVLGIMKVRFVHWLVFVLVYPFMILPWTMSLMLTGAWAGRAGWLSAQRSSRDYRRLLVLGLLIGLPIAALRTWLIFSADVSVSTALSVPLNAIDALALAGAWLAIVMLVIRAGVLVSLRRRLAAVGRMALTNYIAQSLICTTLFYGYGFGLFASLSRTALLGVVAAVWLLQLAWSPWWLARFERGPLEAAWRRLTYGRPRPPAPGPAEGSHP